MFCMIFFLHLTIQEGKKMQRCEDASLYIHFFLAISCLITGIHQKDVAAKFELQLWYRTFFAVDDNVL